MTEAEAAARARGYREGQRAMREAAVDAAWERTRLHVQAELPRVLSPTQLRLLPWPAGMLYTSKEPMKGIRVFYSGN